jgi:hypothetical protein
MICEPANCFILDVPEIKAKLVQIGDLNLD